MHSYRGYVVDLYARDRRHRTDLFAMIGDYANKHWSGSAGERGSEGAVRFERVSAGKFGGRVEQHAVDYFGFADKGASVPIECDRPVGRRDSSGEA